MAHAHAPSLSDSSTLLAKVPHTIVTSQVLVATHNDWFRPVSAENTRYAQPELWQVSPNPFIPRPSSHNMLYGSIGGRGQPMGDNPDSQVSQPAGAVANHNKQNNPVRGAQSTTRIFHRGKRSERDSNQWVDVTKTGRFLKDISGRATSFGNGTYPTFYPTDEETEAGAQRRQLSKEG